MSTNVRMSYDESERRRLVFSMAVALLVHAGLFVALLQWSRARPAGRVEQEPALQLRLIAEPVPVHEVQEPVVAPASPVSPPRAPAAPKAPAQARDDIRSLSPAPQPARPAASAPIPMPAAEAPSAPVVEAATGVEPSLHLFERDGSIVLPDPDSAPGDPAAFGSRARVPAYTPNPMVHRSPLPYEPTRFEGYWAPADENLLGEWMRRATFTRSWDTRYGTRITCSVFVLFGGCGWGHTPRVSIEELRRMRVEPPMPRPSPLLPAVPKKD